MLCQEFRLEAAARLPFCLPSISNEISSSGKIDSIQEGCGRAEQVLSAVYGSLQPGKTNCFPIDCLHLQRRNEALHRKL